MFKEDLLEALRKIQRENSSEKGAVQAIEKIQDQKRLSSEEFLRVFDAIRKDGPYTNYKMPDNWSQPERRKEHQGPDRSFQNQEEDSQIS